MPVRLWANGREIDASWGMDVMVAPERKRKGLGEILFRGRLTRAEIPPQRILPGGQRHDAIELVVGERCELRTLCSQRDIGDQHRQQARVPFLPHHARDLQAHVVPARVPRADTVVQTWFTPRHKRLGRSGDVHDITW